MRKLLLYSALLLLTQCSTCKDNEHTPREPKLPAETQTGVGMMGCRVNGKVFAATKTTRVNATWGCKGDCISISGQLEDSEDSGALGLALNGVLTDDATFTLLDATQMPPNANYGSAAFSYSACDYDGRLIKNGQVTLTRFDEVARVASGRFAFVLYKPGCDTLRVTDGRFDVKF